MNIYEHNFRRLSRLMPDLRRNNAEAAAQPEKPYAICLNIIEKHKYTTVIQLSQRLPLSFPLLTFPVMKIRVCHDARVAEVLSYQMRSRFKPKYAYPNAHMCQIREKQRVNEFLGEWLDHCLGIRTTYLSVVTQ